MVNFLTLMIGAIIYLRELVLLTLGKKVVKSTSMILIHLIVFFYTAALFITDTYLIYLMISGLLVSYLLFKYFFGVEYKIQANNLKKLEMEVSKAIKDTLNLDYRIAQKDKLTKFKIEGNGTIILKETEGLTDRRSDYYIIFRRWGLFQSKREIIGAIEDSLKEEEYERKGVKTAVKFALYIIIVIYSAIFYSNILIEEEIYLNPAISQDFPEEIYITRTNSHYRDKETLEKLQEILSQTWGSKYKARISEEEIKETSEFIIEFKDSKRVVYIGNRSQVYTPEIYVFVHGSEVGSKSILHNMAWQVFRLHNKSNGNYYHVSLSKWELNNDLKTLLKDIR